VLWTRCSHRSAPFCPRLIAPRRELPLDGLEELADALVRLTVLGNLTIAWCGKLKALPRRIGELGSLRELTLRGLNELQEMPDPIGLTAVRR
jgi:hypothetical protein